MQYPNSLGVCRHNTLLWNPLYNPPSLADSSSNPGLLNDRVQDSGQVGDKGIYDRNKEYLGVIFLFSSIPTETDIHSQKIIGNCEHDT